MNGSRHAVYSATHIIAFDIVIEPETLRFPSVTGDEQDYRNKKSLEGVI